MTPLACGRVPNEIALCDQACICRGSRAAAGEGGRLGKRQAPSARGALVALGIGAIIGAGLFVAHRRGDRRPRRPGGGARLRRRRHRLRLRRPLLRRVRLDDPDRRQRLHLRLRHHGRARRLDHRLGPGARVRGRRRHGGDRLERVLQHACSAASACSIPYQWSHSPFEHAGVRSERARHHEPARDLHPARAHAAAGARHPGVGLRQRHHRRSPRSPSCSWSSCSAGASSTRRTTRRFIPAATQYATPHGVTHNYGGIMGILGAAGVVFFAFIGFDAVSTAAQEAKNPKRDMPIGILGSLAVCTVLYVLFSYVLTGLAHGRGLPRRRPRGLGRLRDHQVHAGLRVALELRDRRHPRRLLVGDPGHAARPVARLLLDEPRRPGAEGLLRRAPALQDAVQVELAVLRLHRRSSRPSCPATSSAR